MYIIELILKLKSDFLSKKNQQKHSSKMKNEKCNHLFLPIDSTGRILACSKCGKIYKLKKNEINPFKNKD